jgi:pimeloyl-ACP methyl ester carboxylesterase
MNRESRRKSREDVSAFFSGGWKKASLFYNHHYLYFTIMSIQKLSLSSGRSLDYIVTGSTSQDATLLVYLHGTPSAYPVMQSLVTKCKEQNIKLLSFSRSGYGDSTRHPGRKVVDIVDDVQALADHVGAKKFFVCGWSGGGKYLEC